MRLNPHRMAPLIERIRLCLESGNLDAWLDVVEQVACEYGPRLRAYVNHRVRGADADDVFQEVLAAISSGLDRFTGKTDAELRSWCYRIAHNKYVDHVRRHNANPVEQADHEMLWQAIEASAVGQPLSAADRADLNQAMELLQQAKPPCYDLLLKHYILGFDYAELAAEYALNYDTARRRVERCVELAQKLLK